MDTARQHGGFRHRSISSGQVHAQGKISGLLLELCHQFVDCENADLAGISHAAHAFEDRGGGKKAIGQLGAQDHGIRSRIHQFVQLPGRVGQLVEGLGILSRFGKVFCLVVVENRPQLLEAVEVGTVIADLGKRVAGLNECLVASSVAHTLPEQGQQKFVGGDAHFPLGCLLQLLPGCQCQFQAGG